MKTLHLTDMQKQSLSIVLNCELRLIEPGTQTWCALNDIFKQLAGRDHDSHVRILKPKTANHNDGQ